MDTDTPTPGENSSSGENTASAENTTAESTAPAENNAPTERDAPADEKAPAGGDENTEDQLDADNAVEEATVAAVDPDNAPG